MENEQENEEVVLAEAAEALPEPMSDRKSTRLNSSH